jgi:hypothetical protein
MKPEKNIGVFVLLSVFMVGRLMAQGEVKEQLTVPLSEPGKPFKIVCHVMYCGIKIIGYEGKDVIVTVTDEGNQRNRNFNSGGMKRIGGSAGGDVSAEEDHNKVTVSSGLSHLSHLEIKVPQAGGTFEVGTVNQGNVDVENVSGQMEVSNVNGSINLSNVSGSVSATTVNGNVAVGFKGVDPQAPMAFSTLNGRIDVTFPQDFKANVKLKAEKGDIYTDYDIDVTKSQPTVNKTTEGHTYRINIDEWVYGKINGGGPEMMIKTTFGSIFIRKAK